MRGTTFSARPLEIGAGLLMMMGGLGLWACGGPGGGGVSVGTGLEPSAFEIRIIDEETASMAPAGTVRDGSGLWVETARANLRRVDLTLPEDRSCADYRAALPEDAASFDDLSPGAGTIEDEPTSGTETTSSFSTLADGATEPLVAASDCSGGRVRFSGPFVVDLINGTATPALRNLGLPRGDYRRLDLRLDRRDPGTTTEATDDLAGYSLVVTGSFRAPVGKRMAVAIRLEFSEDLGFESDHPVSVTGDSENRLGLSITSTDWLAGVAELLQACLTSSDVTIDDGELVIDNTGGDQPATCDDVEGRLKENFRTHADFGRADS